MKLKIVKKEIKTENEIFMSKFSKLKNVFEKKEKVKITNKNKNPKFKTSAAKRNNFVPKQETPPNKLHHLNIKKVNSDEKILLVRKVVPQDEATSRSPPNIEKEKNEERIPPRKVIRQVTLKVTTTNTLPHQPPLTQPPNNQQPPPTNNHKEHPATTTTTTHQCPTSTTPNQQPSPAATTAPPPQPLCATTTAPGKYNHNQHQPPVFTVPPVNSANSDNLLQGNVVTPTLTKMSELKKMFEVNKVEDNQQAKKTTTTTRKTTSARKTHMKQEEVVPHLQWGKEDTRNNSTDFRAKFMFGKFDRVGRQPDAFVLTKTVVPPDYLKDTTAVQPASTTTDPNIPSKAPSSKCLLPFSPLLEPQHVVDLEICASQAEEPKLMTSEGKALYHQ